MYTKLCALNSLICPAFDWSRCYLCLRLFCFSKLAFHHMATCFECFWYKSRDWTLMVLYSFDSIIVLCFLTFDSIIPNVDMSLNWFHCYCIARLMRANPCSLNFTQYQTKWISRIWFEFTCWLGDQKLVIQSMKSYIRFLF